MCTVRNLKQNTFMNGGYIDIVCNVFTQQTVREDRTGIDDEFKRQVRMPEDMRNGVSVEDYLAKMDRSGIDRSLLIAVRAGDLNVPGSFEVPYHYVREICQQYPGRFYGLTGVDPTRGMQGLRDLGVAVHEHGFVGVHCYPHWFAMPPNAPQVYP